jgi:DNA polymerase-3 subunit delta
MLILLYGKDTYRMRRKLEEIVKHYKKIHQSGLNLKYLDCQTSKKFLFSDFKDELRQSPMFKEKKLLIITNVFADSGFGASFLKEKEAFLKLDNIILFYQPGEIDKRQKLFKFLKEKAKCQEFDLLAGSKLRNWVGNEFKQNKTAITREALERLCDFVGSDLWRMSNEIKKLAAFKIGNTIQAEDVEILVRQNIESDIFKTIDAVAEKNKKKAFELLGRHLTEGDSPLYLLSMIGYQFKNILMVKDLTQRGCSYSLLSRRSGLHPFVVQKSYYQSQKFSFPELKKIYQNIFQADLDIKTGKLDPRTALDLLIAKI